MAIEDSPQRALPVKEIYAWILEHFPYFKNAPTGWKNSVRHNLSLNKCFRKVEKAPVSFIVFCLEILRKLRHFKNVLNQVGKLQAVSVFCFMKANFNYGEDKEEDYLIILNS
jgi:hypothetical protein